VKILAPVSRRVAGGDPAVDAAFYRDILGFQLVGSNEAHFGPARLEFDHWDEEFSAEVLFFQVDSVQEWRDAIIARGGKPSKPRRVNGIKMEMFEIRDPAFNILWFGESFDYPVPAAPPPQLQKALPELPCNNVKIAVAYYVNILGFGINYQQDDLAVLYRDEVTLLLHQRTPEFAGIGAFEVYVENADRLYEEFLAKGAKIPNPPVSQPWGLRVFQVYDCEGNRITFAQTFE
jgi:catechol 2,3-dioxygenase-like lactoylglutathione lyase family enzyme